VKFRYAMMACLILASGADAGPLRNYRARHHPPAQPVPGRAYPVAGPPIRPQTVVPEPSGVIVQPAGAKTELVPVGPPGNPAAGDALDMVNAKRAAHGLRPYVRDEGLTQAAFAAASYRAQHLMFGHTRNDFQFLPPGCNASSAGCAAYPASFGFMACDIYDNYTFAGAAWVPGPDGKMYCHLFVR